MSRGGKTRQRERRRKRREREKAKEKDREPTLYEIGQGDMGDDTFMGVLRENRDAILSALAIPKPLMGTQGSLSKANAEAAFKAANLVQWNGWGAP